MMRKNEVKLQWKIRIQKTWGPIGLALTGDVADWDKRYLLKLESPNMKPLVYSRLKDDILREIVVWKRVLDN